MLQKSRPEEKFGCLFGILGALSGVLIGQWHFARYVAEEHTAHPDEPICGTPIIGAIGIGLFVGAFGGTLLGAMLGYFLPRRDDGS